MLIKKSQISQNIILIHLSMQYSMFLVPHSSQSVRLIQTEGQRLTMARASQMSVTPSCFLWVNFIQEVIKESRSVSRDSHQVPPLIPVLIERNGLIKGWNIESERQKQPKRERGFPWSHEGFGLCVCLKYRSQQTCWISRHVKSTCKNHWNWWNCCAFFMMFMFHMCWRTQSYFIYTIKTTG